MSVDEPRMAVGGISSARLVLLRRWGDGAEVGQEIRLPGDPRHCALCFWDGLVEGIVDCLVHLSGVPSRLWRAVHLGTTRPRVRQLRSQSVAAGPRVVDAAGDWNGLHESYVGQPARLADVESG